MLDCWIVGPFSCKEWGGKRERSFGTLKWMILGVETGKTFGNLHFTPLFTLQMLYGDLAITKLMLRQM